MLDRKIKNLWVEGLRSGAYQQTKETLRDDQGFCCLGVLCDIVDPDGWHQQEMFGRPYFTYANGVAILPPQKLLNKLGLTLDNATTLSYMNDKEGANFHQIADHIEANL